MHGLANKALEVFLGDTFGEGVWHAILESAGLWDQIGADGFDALRSYPDAVTQDIIAAASMRLDRHRDALLEDLGTYLVTHERCARVRRLLRFGGSNYSAFLRSLDDLQGRVQLAVPEFVLPGLALEELGPGRFRLSCPEAPPGFIAVLMGVLRAMGDDYGALVVLEVAQAPPDDGEAAGQLGALFAPGDDDATAGLEVSPGDCLMISVHDSSFHQGRRFELAAVGAA